MKFKYPKTLRIGATVFEIIYDYKDNGGASFKYGDKKEKPYIKFGMMGHKNNSLQFLEFIIHELKEIIHIEQNTRFSSYNSGGYLFNYEHAQHTDLCSRLAGLLTEFIL